MERGTETKHNERYKATSKKFNNDAMVAIYGVVFDFLFYSFGSPLKTGFNQKTIKFTLLHI